MDNLLDRISQDVKQKIFECIFQAIGEDKQEANVHLGLRTHVSGPFLNWDLIYRNLMNSFGNENVKYSTMLRVGNNGLEEVRHRWGSNAVFTNP